MSTVEARAGGLQGGDSQIRTGFQVEGMSGIVYDHVVKHDDHLGETQNIQTDIPPVDLPHGE